MVFENRIRVRHQPTKPENSRRFGLRRRPRRIFGSAGGFGTLLIAYFVLKEAATVYTLPTDLFDLWSGAHGAIAEIGPIGLLVFLAVLLFVAAWLPDRAFCVFAKRSDMELDVVSHPATYAETALISLLDGAVGSIEILRQQEVSDDIVTKQIMHELENRIPPFLLGAHGKRIRDEYLAELDRVKSIEADPVRIFGAMFSFLNGTILKRMRKAHEGDIVTGMKEINRLIGEIQALDTPHSRPPKASPSRHGK